MLFVDGSHRNLTMKGRTTVTDFNDNTRYALIQRLNEKPNYCSPDDYKDFKIKNSVPDNIVMLLVLILLVLSIGLVVKSCQREPMPAVIKSDCTGCHNRTMLMTQYFRNKGSKNPEEMAYAVLQTKSPRLLASIAVRESDGNYKVRNSGYKNRHSGAYQVNPKHWGTVPTDALGQSRQAERILQELTETLPITKALNYYGGESNVKGGKYAANVLHELQYGGIP